MNREIKFRGKRLDGKWVYGCLIYDNAQTRIVTDIGRYNSEICECKSVEVDPETVGQFTGLKDKNGNGEEIYEKDIMEFDAYETHYIGVVEYCGSAFGIICRTASGVKVSPYLDDAIDRHGAIKIGNIHDNPELTKEEK